MFSLRSLLVAAPLLAVALAQKVALTSTPAVIEAGSDYNITWGGGDGSSVTLTLRRGNPSDLDTVSTIASNIEGYSYLWTVPTEIEDGDDYALQITQGQDDINWTGLFTIDGGSSNSSSSSTTASSNSTMTMTSAASVSGTGTAMSRNVTFSTASLTTSNTFGEMTSTRTSSATAAATSAPNSNTAPIKAGSSVALIFGIVAAVMLH